MSEPPCQSRSFDFRIIGEEEDEEEEREKNVVGYHMKTSAASISAFLSQHIYKLITKLVIINGQ